MIPPKILKALQAPSDPHNRQYKLMVRDVGEYEEDSLLKLWYTIFKHRLNHLIKGEGWRD
jgi:hypothetical protein